MIPRPTYLSLIEPLIGKDIVKVLTGMRRSGKSTLLGDIKSLLLTNGVRAENIVAMNFESLRWEEATESPRALYETVLSLTEGVEGRLYLFFDEIQVVREWERAVNSLRVDLDCDIYLTGSNSKLLSGELSTLLAGRYIAIEVFPFSLQELKSAFPEKETRELYGRFRTYGGLPFLSHIDYAPESSLAYLNDVYGSIVLRDIVQRHGFRNSDQLERVLGYFISEIGTTLSVENISHVLREEGRPASVDSIYNYLQAAEDALLLSRVRRFDIKGKALLRGGEKAYLTDIGLREALLGSNGRRPDLVLENLVFVELRRRGFQVHVGRIGKKEIDFVAEREGNLLYIQVAYLLESERTREREFSALEEVKDGYPKMIVSADEEEWSRSGIRCFNIIDFLTSSVWER